VLVGNIIDAEVYFSPGTIWVLTTRKDGQDLINRCAALNLQGNVLACEDKLMSDDSWLSRIHGKCGAGKQVSAQSSADYLLSTIDGGVVQVGISNGAFIETRRFDVLSINSDDKLIYSDKGLYIWGNHEIRLLSTRSQTVSK
jgi:hypothetical protein